MDQQPDVARRDSVEWAATIALTQWMRQIGEPGRAALAGCPGLSAAVDQHAAEVRDVLADAGGEISVVALAAYADGVNDVAAARGWALASLAGTVRWSRAPWPLVRMLAVCLLAAGAGHLG